MRQIKESAPARKTMAKTKECDRPATAQHQPFSRSVTYASESRYAIARALAEHGLRSICWGGGLVGVMGNFRQFLRRKNPLAAWHVQGGCYLMSEWEALQSLAAPLNS
jgi:hypothetical protein